MLYSLTRKDIYIIAGSSAAAAAVILIILSVTLIVIIVRRKAGTKREKKDSSKPQHTVTNGSVTLDKSRDPGVPFIPVAVNEAYATAAFTQGNAAYTAAGPTHDYEEYSYIN